MIRTALVTLYLSIALLFPIFVFSGSFLPLYYVLWVLGVGRYVYNNRHGLEQRFQHWRMGAFPKFLSIGVCVILLEEMFAALSMHLMRYLTTGSFMTYGRDVLQFWMLNLLTLPGMIIGWYFLLSRFTYTKKEVFILAGLFGLFSEKLYQHIAGFPLVGLLLIMPTFFTYGLIVSIPALSLDHTGGKKSHFLLRYGLGLLVPFLCSVPFIGVLSYLLAVAPELFPPFGYFQ